MTQLNTPYPATAYLTGFLRQHEARLGIEVAQADAALELFLRVFSRRGLERVFDEIELDGSDRYVDTVDAVVRFLQGRDPGFALRIVGRELLPEGPRFAALEQGPGAEDDDPLAWAFGNLGI